MPIPNECPQCHSHSLRMFGNGSEKIEEEIKKFHPSLEVDEAEDAIYNSNTTDLTDILLEMMQETKENR